MTRERRLQVAWRVILVADLGVLAYGVLALLAPGQLEAGYESFADRRWSELVSNSPVTADFIHLLFRLLGAFNVAVGTQTVAAAATAFRRGERWAWWALLVGNTIGFGAPITYDQMVGAIGPFEILEVVALAGVYASLAATAFLVTPRPTTRVPESGLR